MHNKDSNHWKNAIAVELEALRCNGTWDVVDSTDDTRTLSTKWVFKIKRDEENKITRYKARLVARGFDQREGLDYSETFAPVSRGETLRTMLAVATKKGYFIRHIDIKTAYLNGKIAEELYLDPPEGMPDMKGKLLRLKKGLYGLKQAARSWYATLKGALEDIGFI